MKRILIPTDFSSCAWSSLTYAIKMFDNIECTFYLLHTNIMSDSSITNFSTNKLNIEKEKTIVELDNLKVKAEEISQNKNHHFETIMSFYHLNDAINYTTEKHEIDFTIIGTKGVTNAKEYILGSNTTKVIKNIKKCPLFVIPSEYNYTTLNQIGLLSDLNHKMSNELLSPLAKLATENNSIINLVHISKNAHLSYSESEELDSIKKCFDSSKFSFHFFEKNNSTQHIANEFITEFNINLLVLTYYKNSFYEKMINKSLTTSLSRHPKIPLLILPNKD